MDQLHQLIITSELSTRKARSPDILVETAAMRRIADTMAADPAKTFEVCVEIALELCNADTCGISLRERNEAGEDIFRWIALTGELKQHLHGTTPRFNSPCGVCVESGAPLLMRRPELHYKYLDVGPPFHDVLLIPLTQPGSELEGTIWIVAHNPSHKFDGEDACVMQRIAIFIAATLHLANIAREATARASEQTLLFDELDHRVKNTLMMTASLLRYQVTGITDPAARAAVEAASGRIMSLGRAHQFRARDSAGDLADVVRTVGGDLIGSDPRFRLKVDAESVVVPAHQAAVVALIVNELVTNAIKHAFGNGSVGTVAISLRRTAGDSVELCVTDDGESLPAKTPDGIGLKLVSRLADQLAGKMSVETAPKQFTVVFPALPAQANLNAARDEPAIA